MCILCIASRWSRHIAAMIMPMVTLWALSQFLPQGFRFEINSPKLACVGVLFVSLSWVELVMPRLSAWRARRIAALKERRRVEAQEAAKRRKKAIRRCRNCCTPYKDQTPGSGRFMCTFCGHVSKRPVLDLPVRASNSRSTFSLPGSAVEFLSSSGFFSVTVSPKYWYDRASFVRPNWGSGRSWIGVGPWIDGVSWGMSTSWFGGAWPGSALYFGNTGFVWPGSTGNLLGDGVFGGERWFAGESYSGFIWFVLRVFSQLLVFTVWIWRKLSRAENVEETGIDKDHPVCHTRDVVESPSFEAKEKKARRKAEEKRLARLEKEQQEAEERKQREEVARLVEERRRQRVKKQGLDESVMINSGKVIEIERKCGRREENFHKRLVSSAKEDISDPNIADLTRKGNSMATEGMKPIRNTSGKEKDANVKPTSTFFSKWSAFTSQGSAKNRLFNNSKKTAVASKNSASWLADSNAPSKPCKNSALGVCSSPSASSTSMKRSENCTSISSSAWTQSPWANVSSHRDLEASTGASSNTSQSVEIMQSPHELVTTSKSDASMESTLASNFKGKSLQPEFKTAASAYDNSHDYPSIGEGSRLKDPSVCQYTSSNFGNSCNHSSGTNESLVRSSGSLLSQSAQYSMSSAASGLFQICTSASPAIVTTPHAASSIAGSPTHSSIYHSLSKTSAVKMHETGMSSLSPLNVEFLPASENLERCSPYQIWGPQTVSMDNIGGLVLNEKWTHGNNLIYPSKINILPVDASFQQRDDLYQQINVEPEFYLPSSLFNFEESDSRECFCEDATHRKLRCLKRDGMEPELCAWEDFDVHYTVPPEFVDCITHSLMQDPVITADGHSYERSAIEDWLRQHDTSPKTGEILPPPPGGKGVDKSVRPNHILRCQILEFRERVMQRFGTCDGLMKAVCRSESDDFIKPAVVSNSFQSLPNSSIPVQAIWSHDAFGDR